MVTPALTAAEREIDLQSPLRRELYFFSLYRLLEVGLLALITFSPVGALVSEPRDPMLARATTIGYLLLAVTLLVLCSRATPPLRSQAMIGLAGDIVIGVSALYALDGVESGIALLLIFNIGAGALLLPLRTGLGFAAIASAGVIVHYVLGNLHATDVTRPIAEAVMFSMTYLATAVFFNLLGGQMLQAQALAERRGEEIANLAEINELIIRRMRKGLMVVDSTNQLRLANEAAWYLLGNPPAEQRDLAAIAPELSRRLWHWRHDKEVDASALALAEDRPEVIPRFTRLSLQDDLYLIFLEDTELFSRRAEELTLTTLAKLTASIAHEIRNPLAAISYSAQLLEESKLQDGDRRLLEIINNQCQRMNGIIQNVLGLARRERAQPEPVDLLAWARRFIEEYRISNPVESEHLQMVGNVHGLAAHIDPQQLQQVLVVLVNNAFTYGRMPGQTPRVSIVVRRGDGNIPLIEVLDRGPGIPPKVAEQLFQAFHTTSEHGTGLGLYIARQLCEANQASLDYVPIPAGGACFRVTLPQVNALLDDLRQR